MADLTYRLEIGGRVQGRFYRASVAAQANALGLRGWVRNYLHGPLHGLSGSNGSHSLCCYHELWEMN